MSNQLDLEEQEQLEELKAFWKQWGNAITWVCIVVLSAFAAWNAYQYWQRNQAAQAAALFDEVQRVQASGDTEKVERVFGDMKSRFGSTVYAAQTGLLTAKVLFDAGKADAAKAALQWVVSESADPGYSTIARLRLAGILLDAKDDAGALKLLEPDASPEFAALQADLRGDVYLDMGDRARAKAQYQLAYKGMDANEQYRRLVEVKLNSLGVDPTAPEAVAASTTKPEAAR